MEEVIILISWSEKKNTHNAQNQIHVILVLFFGKISVEVEDADTVTGLKINRCTDSSVFIFCRATTG